MSEANTSTEANIITNQDNAKVVPIKKGKLLKLRHDIERMRQEFVTAYQQTSKEANSLQEECHTASTLIGELNDDIKSEGKHD